MQKVTRKFQEKIETISKIQSRTYRKHETTLLFDRNSPELPPITNSLSSPKKFNSIPLNTIITVNSGKVDNQYDVIINQTLSQFKNQNINRIIFASPLNRFGKTYYRKNEFNTLESCSFRNHSEQKGNLDSKRKKQFQDYLQNHVEKHKYGRQSYNNMTLNIPQQRKTSYEETNTVYFTAPEQIEKDPIPYSFRRNNKRKSRQRKASGFGRYSPWCKQQNEQQLMNLYR